MDSTEIDAAEQKRERKEARKVARAAAEQAAAAVDESEAKRQRKAARQAAREAASKEIFGHAELKSSDCAIELDEVDAIFDAKRQKKAAKKAAVLAAVGAEVAVGSRSQDQEDAEAKRIRRAAKKANTEATSIKQEAAWEWFTQVANELEEKKKRKAAAKLLNGGLATDALAQPETPKRKASTQVVEETEADREESHPTKRSKTSGAAGSFTAFIRGLPFSVTQDAIERSFADCGQIESVNMPKNDDGKPRGLAFVKFTTPQALEAALKFDNTEYGGRTIYVEKAGEGKDGECKRSGANADAKKSQNGVSDTKFTAFIKGLPLSAPQAIIEKDFADCGEIASVNIPKDQAGKPKGLAFIKFLTQEALEAALKFNATEYGGRTIYVEKAGEKTKVQSVDSNGERNNPLTVCIKCLPFAAEEAVIRKDFAECGEIVKMNLLKDEEGKSRGMAFVTYKTQEGFDAALKFNETEYGGRTILVARPKVKGKDDKGDEDKDAKHDKVKGKGKGKGKDGKGKGKHSKAKGKDGKGKGKKGKESNS